jgi:hypothetical protein
VDKERKLKALKILLVVFLTIAVIVIITGIPNKICGMIYGIGCIAQPISESVTTIQEAQSGLMSTTGVMCMGNGDVVKASDIAERLSTVSEIIFKCEENSLCEGLLEVNEDIIRSNGNTLLKLRAECNVIEEGDYECSLTVISEGGSRSSEEPCYITFFLFLFAPAIITGVLYVWTKKS